MLYDQSSDNKTFSIEYILTKSPEERLNPKHRTDLISSGLPADNLPGNYFSLTAEQAAIAVGFRQAGMGIMYLNFDGSPMRYSNGDPYVRLKVDNARGRGKYLTRKGEPVRAYIPQLPTGSPSWEDIQHNADYELLITEGEKKADSLAAHGYFPISLPGVSCGLLREKNEEGIKSEVKTPLIELRGFTWKHRSVPFIFDSDVIQKWQVNLALTELATYLFTEGAKPKKVYLPTELDGGKNGADDLIYRHGIDALIPLINEAPDAVYLKKTRNAEELVSHGFSALTSEYLARMFQAVTCDRLGFWPNLGWYEWVGTHWKLMAGGETELKSLLYKFMDQHNWLKRSESLKSLILSECQARFTQTVIHNRLPCVIFPNGTGYIDREAGSLTFQPSHNRGDFNTQLLPFDFDSSADCPIFKAFLTEAQQGDREVIGLLLDVGKFLLVGQDPSRPYPVEVFIDLIGPKGSGKGTFANVIVDLIGQENIGSASPATFSKPELLASLRGKRLAVDMDSQGHIQDSGLFCQVVSNEPVPIRNLYCLMTCARLGVTVFRAMNNHVTGNVYSSGLDRRVLPIPFNHVVSNPDRQLKHKLSRELAGIFNLFMRRDYQDALTNIQTAKDNIQAIKTAASDRLEELHQEVAFARDVHPNGIDNVSAKVLYPQYQAWAEQNGRKVMSSTKFGSVLKNRTEIYLHRRTKDGIVYSIKPNSELTPEDFSAYQESLAAAALPKTPKPEPKTEAQPRTGLSEAWLKWWTEVDTLAAESGKRKADRKVAKALYTRLRKSKFKDTTAKRIQKVRAGNFVNFNFINTALLQYLDRSVNICELAGINEIKLFSQLNMTPGEFAASFLAAESDQINTNYEDNHDQYKLLTEDELVAMN